MIPFFDAASSYLTHQAEIDAAIRRVLLSGRLILGPEVAGFEREFAQFVGAHSAIGVASGTDALTLALRALGVGSADEVVTVANAGVPPVAAIRAVLATPRFVDVLPGLLLMDPRQLAAAITERTRCILVVHLYGSAAPMPDILDVARVRHVPIVEDCAQAHGACWAGRHVGTFGDIGCFSFYPTKNLGALGDGGMCVTNRPELAERVRLMRQYGWRDDGQAECEGSNSRLDELQAAILRVKLARLTDGLAARRRLAARYDRGLAGTTFELPPTDSGHAHHLYVIRDPQRQRTMDRMRRAGIECRVHYPVPVHHMPAYAFLGYGRGDLPITEAACRQVLSLPLYPELGDAAVDRIVTVLLENARSSR